MTLHPFESSTSTEYDPTQIFDTESVVGTPKIAFQLNAEGEGPPA